MILCQKCPWEEWPPFCRRHFQMHFLKRKCMNFDLNFTEPLQWRHNGLPGVSNHQPRDCLLNRLFSDQRKLQKAPRHWPLCGEFTGTGEFPAQRASNAENVSIWWRHHDLVPHGPIDNNGSLLEIVAWRRLGDKSLSEPPLLTHICVTPPQ